MQVAVVLALTDALVAKFGGSDRGLGILIQNGQLNLDSSGMAVVLVMLSLLGIGGTGLVRFVQRRVVDWESKADRPAFEN